MKNFRIVLLPLLMAVFFIACKSEEKNIDHLALEREQMKKQFSDDKVVETYRAFKVALRGSSKMGDPEFAEARQNLLAFSAQTVSLLAHSDSTKSVSATDLLKAGKQINSAKEVLLKTDEDSLPTVLENINSASQALGASQTSITDLINESTEHLIIGTSLLISQRAPASVVLYEYDRVQHDQLIMPELRVMADLSRSIVYSQNKYPYHSEQAADQLIQDSEKDKAALKNMSSYLALDQEKISEEQAWHRLHSFGFLMRGLARQDMPEKKEAGIEDWQTFMSEAEAGGLDNELVWTVGAYINIHNDKNDEAKKYLDKLAASPNLGTDEREVCKKAADHLDKNQADGFFKDMGDKLFLLKLSSKYAEQQIQKSESIAQLKQSASGKSFFTILDEANGFFNIIAPFSSADSLKNKAKSLLDKVF